MLGIRYYPVEMQQFLWEGGRSGDSTEWRRLWLYDCSQQKISNRCSTPNTFDGECKQVGDSHILNKSPLHGIARLSVIPTWTVSLAMTGSWSTTLLIASLRTAGSDVTSAVVGLVGVADVTLR